MARSMKLLRARPTPRTAGLIAIGAAILALAAIAWGNQPRGFILPSEEDKVVILGDSWTAGYAAEPKMGFARVLSEAMAWDSDIYGLTGAGYVSRGGDEDLAFPDYVPTLTGSDEVTMVVIQGGLNDAYIQTPHIRQNIRATLESLKSTYPNASIVAVGPASPKYPVTEAFVKIDEAISEVADEVDAYYVSPLKEEWLTNKNLHEFIDYAKLAHPNTAGHAYFADRLATSLRALSD